jgi:hypothetical protein
MRVEAKVSARASTSIPLAEQLRRRPAKPQRLVQLQHGIPTRIGVERYTPVFQIGIQGALP